MSFTQLLPFRRRAGETPGGFAHRQNFITAKETRITIDIACTAHLSGATAPAWSPICYAHAGILSALMDTRARAASSRHAAFGYLLPRRILASASGGRERWRRLLPARR